MSRLHSRRPTTFAPSRRNRSGISILFVGIALIVLLGFVSLAIDIGRLRLANAQLQTAADASARAGAWSLPGQGVADPNQDVINEAVTAALDNPAISNASTGERQDAGVTLDTTKDIHFGTWDPAAHTFTEITDPDKWRSANSIKTETWRSASRGNPVKLIFAPIVGVFTKNSYGTATAYITGGSDKDFGFVGINHVGGTGNPAGVNGGVASDGDIDLINGDVNGDCRAGINGKITEKPNTNITGWTANLDYTIASLYPIYSKAPAGTPPIPTGNNPTLIGGPDYAHQKAYTGQVPSEFTVSGYVRIYATSNLDLKAVTVNWTDPNTINPATTPSRLEYYMTGNVTSVKGNGNVVTYCHVYAPQCDVEIGGTQNFYGWAIGKTLSFIGTSSFNYDGTKIFTPGPYILHLVQ